MHMGDRPATAPLTCPIQVLVFEEADFPLRISSAMSRARESKIVGRFGNIFWVISSDNPNQVLRFDESELRKWLESRNSAAVNKENS